MKLRHRYRLLFEGNDLDAKTVQRLSAGDSLVMERLRDEEDTFDIVIKTASGRELDMLSYGESLGIAPYLDDGSLVVIGARVESVNVREGRTRAKDLTSLAFSIDYEYGEDLEPFERDGILYFLSKDPILDTAVIHFCTTHRLMERPYLNVFELSGEPEEGQEICLRVIFNEKFTNCRFSLEIGGETVDMDEEMKDTALDLVNHRRMLVDDEEPVDPVYDN
ncbi:MAG: hypothetical protein IJG64_03625 [Oscillospiraceae bacterium]|nr:hypothetical protein [Oscillospiraceae bacterium]